MTHDKNTGTKVKQVRNAVDRRAFVTGPASALPDSETNSGLPESVMDTRVRNLHCSITTQRETLETLARRLRPILIHYAGQSPVEIEKASDEDGVESVSELRGSIIIAQQGIESNTRLLDEIISLLEI